MADPKARARRARRKAAERMGQEKAARLLGDALARSEAARARATAMLATLLQRAGGRVVVTQEDVDAAIRSSVHVEAVEGGVAISLVSPEPPADDLPSAEAP